MSFKIKTFRESVNSMASWIKDHSLRLNNFYVGSVIRTLIEGVAIEIESLYYQMHKGFRYAIEYSIYNSFSFSQNPATKASGVVTVTFRSPLTQQVVIPKDFLFSTIPYNGTILYYKTTVDTVCLEGLSSASVDVECTEAGTLGNVSANSIVLMTVPISEIATVYNPNPLANGAEKESKENLKQRFQLFIETLAKGTISAIRFGVLSVSGVAGVYVSESAGSLDIYTHDSSGLLPQELSDAITVNLINYRSAGIGVTLHAPTIVEADISIEVTMSSSIDPGDYAAYETQIAQQVISYVNVFPISRSLLRSALVIQILDIDPVILNVTTDLIADIVVQPTEIIRAGTITVTCIG